jgi:predicted nucleotidyltransferase component of viral defense system
MSSSDPIRVTLSAARSSWVCSNNSVIPNPQIAVNDFVNYNAKTASGEFFIMPKRVTHLDRNTAIRWAENVQICAVVSLMQDAQWRVRDVAFQGGTSLHLSWRSPRFSEDMDFLLTRRKTTQQIGRILQRTLKRTQERMLALDPLFSIELHNRTRDADKMPVYQFIVTHPSRVRRVLVKCEFWRVDDDYLAGYPIELRTPAATGDIVSHVGIPIPAASLQSAYADKLSAFATRPYLKSRDVFDLWWIGTQTNADIDHNQAAVQFLHNVSAYDTLDGLPPAQALRKFLGYDSKAIFDSASKDLQRWLPSGLWRQIYPDRVHEMIEYVRNQIGAVADQIDASGAAKRSDAEPPTS